MVLSIAGDDEGGSVGAGTVKGESLMPGGR